MSVKSCVKRNIAAINSDAEVRALGYNMLFAKKAEITLTDSNIVPKLKRQGNFTPNAFLGCCTENLHEHIDIFGDKADIVCDLGYVAAIETILIRTLFHASVNYSIGEFELYASDTRNEIFNSASKIAHEKGIDSWHEGERNNADWIYDVVGNFRYLGIRILKANAVDDIIRLGHVGVYNSKYTEGKKYLSEYYPNNLLKGKEPYRVTDDLLFNGERAVEISGEHTFDFELGEQKKLLRLLTVVCGDVSVDAGEDFVIKSVTELDHGRKAYDFTAANDKATDKISLICKGNGFVEHIGAYESNISLAVDFDNVIIEDFIGVGADVIPSAFMPESLATGYNEVYWQLDKCRIEKVRPHCVRLWFQIDWIVTEYEKYKNGVFDFDSEKMLALYRYLDLFKDIGAEIEFNFGWKITEPVQEWFAFDNIIHKRGSAPRELEPFAEACGSLMYELIVNRNYSNIKYLTFFNECDNSEWDSLSQRYDFAVPHGILAREYYADMINLCKQNLVKRGLDNLEIWGFELTDRFDGWAQFTKEKYGDIVDRYTFHKYFVRSSDDEDSLLATSGLFKKATYYTDKPVVMTECGQVDKPEEHSFNMNHVQLFCDAANNGISGIFIWCLNGVHLTQPCNFMMRNGMDMWNAVQCRGGIENVKGSFYELAMLARYIPNHCKAVKTVTEDNGVFYRACAFKTDDGNQTIVLEVDRGMTDRKVNICLNIETDKPFYKHMYKRPCLMDGNALIPPVSKIIYGENVLNDSIDSDYQCIVYTTFPPVPQIAVCSNEIMLLPNEQRNLSAAIIDGEGGIDWKISESTDDSFELEIVGNYASLKAKQDAKIGSMTAIEVTSRKYPEAKNIIIAKIG